MSPTKLLLQAKQANQCISTLPNEPRIYTNTSLYRYDTSKGYYGLEDAMRTIRYGATIPFTPRQIAMIKHLLHNDKLQHIMALCAYVFPFEYAPDTLRRAVKRCVEPIQCTTLDFLYDYESMFGDRDNGTDTQADRLAYLHYALRPLHLKSPPIKRDVIRKCYDSLRIHGTVSARNMAAEFNISLQYAHKCISLAKSYLALQLKPDCSLNADMRLFS